MTVVMSGELAVAGSSFSFLSSSGMQTPIRLPRITTRNMLRPTTRPKANPPLQIPMPQATSPVVKPRAVDTPASLRRSEAQSFVRISPTAMARIMRVADWEPALPPLSIKRGRKKTRGTRAAMVASNRAMIPPETAFTNTRATSQRILFRYRREADASFRPISSGATAAAFWMSSVASSTATSRTSSAVTIPTRTPSESTTGRTVRS